MAGNLNQNTFSALNQNSQFSTPGLNQFSVQNLNQFSAPNRFQNSVLNPMQDLNLATTYPQMPLQANPSQFPNPVVSSYTSTSMNPNQFSMSLNPAQFGNPSQFTTPTVQMGFIPSVPVMNPVLLNPGGSLQVNILFLSARCDG
jgi:hypothetical protein